MDGKLKVVYSGKEKGTQYYTYAFSSDGNKLEITHKGTYKKEPETVIWIRVD